MSTDDRWIRNVITEAQAQRALVTEAVTSRLAEALEGHLSEQRLSRKDLASLASALITDMIPKPPETDPRQ